MYMDAGMDTGDMILKEEVLIGEDETTGEIWDKLANIGGNLLVKTLEKIEKGQASRIKQGEDFSIAPMLTKENAKIDFQNMSAIQIKNLVRGLNPIMGAYAYLDDKKIKIWKAQAIDEKTFIEQQSQLINRTAANEEAVNHDESNIQKCKEGTILISDSKKGLYIKTKQGILKILEIQGENSKRMPVEDYLRGNLIEKGKTLS